MATIGPQPVPRQNIRAFGCSHVPRYNMQAQMLGAAASEQDAIERLTTCTGSILPLFTVEQVRNATRANPHGFLGGCVQVAMATPSPSAPNVVRGVAPKVVLERRYRTPAPAPAASLAAAPGPKTAGPPRPKPAGAPRPKAAGVHRPKAVWAGQPRGIAKKENVALQNQTPTATGKAAEKKTGARGPPRWKPLVVW